MGKHCLLANQFQQAVDNILRAMAREQEIMLEYELKMNVAKGAVDKYKLELNRLTLKGDCDKCIHKLECTTNGELLTIKKENQDGW